MRRILVTGATGFLGKYLVEQLKQSFSAESGVGSRKLRVLCRGASPWDSEAVAAISDRRSAGGGTSVTAGDIEVVRGDVASRDDVEQAMARVEEVYHLAGVVSRNPQKKWLLYQTHVEGTRNVCEAACKCGVQKIVAVSSSGTIAVGREPVAHDENSGYKHELVGEWPYYLSKIFAEKLAFSYFEQHALPIVVVNPSLLLGPGDDRQSSTHDVALFLEGQVLAIPLGGLNFVDVRDAAAGLIAAMRRGTPGERYLLGGPNWSFREFIENLSTVSGVRAPRLQPSLRFSLTSARALRWLLPLVGKSFELDDVSIKMSSLFWYCDSKKARAELGFKTRDPMQTLKETVESLSKERGRR